MTQKTLRPGRLAAAQPVTGGTSLSRRSLLAGVGAATLTASCSDFSTGSGPQSPPNIVFIMADDLGYADLSCFGRRDYETPRIDSLAAEGVRLTSAYSNSPVCSATRTALMSGQYQYRLPVGLEEPLATRNVGFPSGHVSLPSILQAAGYQTALVGKWHLGRLPDYSPLTSGYDHFWGYRNGGVDYFSHTMGGRPDLWDGDVPVEETGYLTDLLGQQAINQVEAFARNGRPFMLSLHFSAPHWPWEGPGDTAESDRLSANPNPLGLLHFDGGTLATYAEMVTRLDHQVGRLLDTLDRLRLSDNTIVVFTSDNGGERFSDTWPFSGRKTELLEGGIRVPTLMRWPGRTTSGAEINAPVMSMDWLPTLAAAAQAGIPENYAPDGLDIAPLLAGDGLPERDLFWRFKVHDQKAVRHGRWKYLSIAGREFLFDVVADPLERGNLKDRYPDEFAALKARYDAWNATMLPYDEASFSHAFNGSELADRFGVDPSESVVGNAMPPGPRNGGH
ncbi:sulfatase [Maricaulis parjimensis]|uniref:sulfatase family protein n=1 Tax=Maricaulis parjimensis TaxID=144023 RepID=UPI00193A9119|nr:sulfatase-like hydrolase/transferase [Maricaulis parjimensis]